MLIIIINSCAIDINSSCELEAWSKEASVDGYLRSHSYSNKELRVANIVVSMCVKYTLASNHLFMLLSQAKNNLFLAVPNKDIRKLDLVRFQNH